MATSKQIIIGPQTLAVVSKSEGVTERRLRRMIASGHLRAFIRPFDDRRTLLVDPADVRSAIAGSLIPYVPAGQKPAADSRKKISRQKHPTVARKLHPAAAAMTR